MAAEYVNRARNTNSGAFVYWVTSGQGDPSMTAAGSPDAGTHSGSVVVGIREVEDAAGGDPNFTITRTPRHVLVTGTTPLAVTYATNRIQ